MMPCQTSSVPTSDIVKGRSKPRICFHQPWNCNCRGSSQPARRRGESCSASNEDV